MVFFLLIIGRILSQENPIVKMHTKLITMKIKKQHITRLLLCIPLFSFATLPVTLVPGPASIGQYQVWEMSFLNSGTYVNPWEDVRINLVFNDQTGDTLRLGGFFYDKGIWKARVAPTKTGTWNYHYGFFAAGDSATGSGSFTCVASSEKGFVRISKVNNWRFQFDDGTPFYAQGFQGSVFRGPGEAGPRGQFNPNSFQQVYYTLSGKDDDLCYRGGGLAHGKPYCYDTTIFAAAMDTMNAAGFNLWRNNNYLSAYVWDSLNTAHGNYYLKTQSQWEDSMFIIVRSKGLRVLNVPFNPGTTTQFASYFSNFGTVKTPAEFAQTNSFKRYLKYLSDRFGVYTDIIEVFNEEGPPSPAWLDSIVPYMRTIDPYHHLITTNSNSSQVDYKVLDFGATHHGYSNTDEQDVDKDAWNFVCGSVYDCQSTGLEKVVPPVLWTEMGNAGPFSDYFPTRFRINVWASFLTQSHFMYWDETGIKSDTAAGGGPANQYIGPEGRQAVRILTNYTSNFPIAHKEDDSYTTGNNAIKVSLPSKARVYGITSANEYMAYFYYFAARPNSKSGWPCETGPLLSGLTTTFIVPGTASTAIWIDPLTGKVIKSQAVSSGQQTLTVPDFMIDIALQVK